MERRGALLSWLAVVVFITLSPLGMAQELDEGIRLYNEGKYEDAERVLRPLAERESSNAQVHYYLGLAFLEMGRLAEAESQLNQASEENLAPGRLKVGQARVALKKGATDRAITLLNEAQAADSENAELYHYRGIARASKQDYAAAAADLEKAIELDPSSAESHYYAGMVYGRLKRTDRMVNHYQMFLRLAPNSPEAPKVQSLLRSVR
jgi:tetratricopeptide (TPR) repeat protein